MNNIPMIRFELENIKQSFRTAFLKCQSEFKQMIESEVESYCTPENLKAVINSTAKVEIDKVIQEEIRSFFQRGKGRRVIADAVKESLLKDIDLL